MRKVMDYRNFIDNYVKISDSIVDKYLIVLVMNVQNITKSHSDYDIMSVSSEFYSYDQYEEIITAVKSAGYEVKCYFDESDFISDFSIGILRDNYPKKIIVINSAQKGTFVGRKSLIPAFCDMNNILYANSDAYTVSFFRNKHHWFSYLKCGNYPVCPSYVYHYKKGWIFNNKPPVGDRIIAKLNSESSSIGLSLENVRLYDTEYETYIHELSKKYNQEVVLESFISGYEVETPMFITEDTICCFPPAGISIDGEIHIKDKILDYITRGKHLFDHYDFSEFNPVLSDRIIATTIDIAKNTDLRGVARIDYRIDNNSNIYITDIATNPHITKSMTYYYFFQKYGYQYCDVLKVVIAITAERFSRND